MQNWLAAQPAASLYISDWVMTEFSSALSIKLRTGQIDLAERALLLAAGQQLAEESLHRLAITPAHFRRAAIFADRYDLALRAADALHLAVAADQGPVVATLDVTLAEAGPLLGVATLLVA